MCLLEGSYLVFVDLEVYGRPIAIVRRVEVLVDLVGDFAVVCFEDGVFEEEAEGRHFGYQDTLVSVQLWFDLLIRKDGGGSGGAGYLVDDTGWSTRSTG